MHERATFFNTFEHTLLKILGFLTMIAQWVFFLGIGAILVAGAIVIIVTSSNFGGIKDELQRDLSSEGVLPLSLGGLLFILLGAILIFISMGLVMHYLNRLILNIADQKFFTTTNLVFIRRTLYAMIAGSVVQWVFGTILDQYKLATATDIFSSTFSNMIGSPITLAAFYVIYIIFKYGLSLQEDSDKVI